MKSNSLALPCPVACLQEPILANIAQHHGLIVSAPPGTGKSSRLPLWLLQSSFLANKKIIVLEPRRMAVRALGRYMASLLGETPGQTVGWRIRGESVGNNCRILVVTEGVLLRMLQKAPSLDDIGCVIFDEFHERSLQSDLGLALCLESQAALRDDLRLIVMSATLDIEKTRELMGNCPVLTCDAPAWPVDIRWEAFVGTDRTCGPAFLQHVAKVTRHAIKYEDGNILVFLPGMQEIRIVAQLLENSVGSGTQLHILHGSVPLAAQDQAIAPPKAGERKVVLATTIAESALTIEGIRIVIDSGYTRSMQHDFSTGIDKLVTQRVTLDSAIQRTGRAGRTQSGVCYRLWAREEEFGFLKQARPEILHADLTGLILNLADWGIVGQENIHKMAWTDLPPESAMALAQKTLILLGALDNAGRITALGRRIARLPTSPRLAKLLVEGEKLGQIPLAASLASILEADNIRLASGDIAGQLAWLHKPDCSPDGKRLRDNASLLARAMNSKMDFTSLSGDSPPIGRLLASAWPERVAQRVRTTTNTKQFQNFILRSGQAASLPMGHPLASQEFLVIPRLLWQKDRGQILQACTLARNDILSLFAEEIEENKEALVTDEGRVQIWYRKSLGKLVLEERPCASADADLCQAALCTFLFAGGAEAIRRLPWRDSSRQWLARVAFMRQLEGEPWPVLDEHTLLASVNEWLGPFLTSPDALPSLTPQQLDHALVSLLPWDLTQRLKTEAPEFWQSPAGIQHRIEYGSDGGPWLSAKLQEFFGCETTPRIASGRVLLALRLNSPAGRPLQITRDLTHFWRNGYASVRSEMLGRYPKHPWPENPLAALPTTKSKKQLCR